MHSWGKLLRNSVLNYQIAIRKAVADVKLESLLINPLVIQISTENIALNLSYISATTIRLILYLKCSECSRIISAHYCFSQL